MILLMCDTILDHIIFSDRPVFVGVFLVVPAFILFWVVPPVSTVSFTNSFS